MLSSPPNAKERPFCSIVLPAKNEQQHIAECLQSLIDQDYPEYLREIIVVDNGSTDSTVAIAEKFADAVYVARDVRVGAVRNHGVERARGEVIVFIDSDCVAPSDWLSTGIALLEARERRIVGGALRSRPNPSWIEKYWLLETEEAVQQHDLMGSCIFIRKADFEKLNGFNESVSSGEDTDLSLRARKLGYDVHMSPALAVVHLGNPSNLRDFMRRQIWHSENYFSNASSPLKDRVFLLVLIHIGAIVYLFATLLSPTTGSLVVALLALQIAPVTLSIKRIWRSRFPVRQFQEPIAILGLDHMYLLARIIGVSRSAWRTKADLRARHRG